MVISGREQKEVGVGEWLRNKRHDKGDRKLNETKTEPRGDIWGGSLGPGWCRSLKKSTSPGGRFCLLFAMRIALWATG